MNKLQTAVLITALSACTSTRALVALNTVDATLFACDATQTYSASGGGQWMNGLHEGNPLQGSTPSTERIYGLMVANVIINAAISVAPVPEWLRFAALGGIGLHVANTVNNNREFVGNRCGL
jgi:hypothetical protein